MANNNFRSSKVMGGSGTVTTIRKGSKYDQDAQAMKSSVMKDNPNVSEQSASDASDFYAGTKAKVKADSDKERSKYAK